MPTDEELSELLARALDDDAPVAPPADRIAGLRAAAEDARRGLDRPAASRPDQPLARRRDGTGGRWGPTVWLVAAAAALVAFALGVGLARSLDDSDGGEAAGGVVEFEGAMSGPTGDVVDAQLIVTAVGIGRTVELATDELPILPTGDYYEVWFVGEGDSPSTPNRISAGTFHPDPDGRTRVQFAAAVNPALYPVVEITAEQGEGNPLPGGPVVLSAVIPP